MIWGLYGSILLAVVVPSQDHTRRSHAQMERLHGNPEAYIAMLEDSGRDSYQKPSEVLQALDIEAGDVIVDIGAGSGYFTFRFAEEVGETGKVYAVDISPDMVLHMNRKIREEGWNNVTTVLADPDDPLLPPASADIIFICDTWHHIQDRPDYLSRLRRVLREGGRLVMVDFKKEPAPVGPGVEEKIARDDLIRELGTGGFEVSREFDFLPYQYFLVFGVRD